MKALTPAVNDERRVPKGTKVSTAEATERERRMRDKCANGLHLSAAILANREVQFDCKSARYISKPQYAWHQHWSHTLSSSDAGFEFAQSLASGRDGAGIIMTTARQLGDLAGLASIGIRVEVSGKVCKKFAADSLDVMSQNALVHKAFDLVFALIHEEVKFMLMWMSTFPYRLAAMFDYGQERLREELQTMRGISKAWSVAKAKSQPFWKALCRHCSLSWAISEDCFELFADEHWEFTERCQRQVRRMFHHNMSTLVAERGFQQLRDHERDSTNRQRSAASLWRHPTRDGVLSEVHSFPEVAPNGIPHKHVEKTSLPSTFFQPVFRLSSSSFEETCQAGGRRLGIQWERQTFQPSAPTQTSCSGASAKARWTQRPELGRGVARAQVS